MKIIVNASAIDSRGAFSVVNSFLYELYNASDELRSKNIKFHILAANEKLCEYNNDIINVEFVRIAKKSWYHKWLYERKILPNLISSGNYDVYLSMQSYILKNIQAKQFVLIHQPIPFSNFKFNDLEFINWLKYNVIFKNILHKQKNNVAGVIVQTKWLKEALIKQYGYNCKIVVIRPTVGDIVNNNIPLSDDVMNKIGGSYIRLLYPTSEEKYKNNQRLINAINLYNNYNERKVKLLITLKGNDSEFIKYIGKVPYTSIFSLYKSTDALIFPSLTETLGLPLLEAQMTRVPIIASDLPYAKEICGDDAIYFNPRSIDSIVSAIKKYVLDQKNIVMKKVVSDSKQEPHKIYGESYLDYIRFIEEVIRAKAT